MGDAKKPIKKAAKKVRARPAGSRKKCECRSRKDSLSADAGLPKSVENFRKAEKIARIGHWDWDLLTNELSWSDEVYRIYGMDPAVDKPTYDIVVKTVAPEYRERLAKAVDDALKNGVSFEGEYRIIGLDGKERFTHAIGEVVRDRAGRPLSMFGIVQDITRRRKVEDALRKAEALYHELVETAQDLVWQCDADGRYTYLNGAWESALGFGVEEMLGRKFSDFQDPEEARRDDELFGRLLRGGMVKGYETVHRAKNGDSVYLVFNAKLVSDDRGNIIGTRGTAHDITERKRAEEALKASEERYRFFLESANDAVLIHPFDEQGNPGHFTEVNELACEWLGYSREEFARMTPRELDDPQHQDHIPRVIAQLKADGHAVFETVVKKKDGGRMPVEISSRMLRMRDRTYIVSLARDITERKQADAALRERERQLGESQRIAHIGSWEHNLTTGKVFWSDELFRILGLDPRKDPADFKVFFDSIHPDDRTALKRAIDETVRTGKHFSIDYRLTLPDGRTRILHAQAELKHDETGAQNILSGTGQDITEQRQQQLLLAEREANYRSLFENSPVALWEEDFGDLTAYFATLRSSGTTDLRAYLAGHPDELYKCVGMIKIIAVNKAALDLYEARDTAALIRNLSQVFTVESFEAFREVMIALYEGAETYECEAVNQTLSGKKIDVLLRWSLLPAPEGHRSHALISIIDISERKRVEGEMRLQGEIARHISEGIYLVSVRELNIVYANPKMESMFGYASGEMNGKHVSIINAPTGADPVETALNIENTLKETGVWRGEVLNIRKNGTTFWGLASISLLHHPKYGEVYVSLQTDITDRKQAEEKIRQNEEFVRSILDTVDEGFIVIDRDYHILTANKAYCGQAGRSCGDIIGKHCFEIAHGISRPCYEEGEECAVRQVFATGEPQTALHRHKDHDGHALYVETKGYPIKDAAGNVTSVIETINNITEKHLLEEERLKTQKLESIGTLAGGIAHDFNNLLQGVFGFISMAKLSGDDKEKSAAALEEAEKALHLAVKLTNQLLTFSKGGKPVRRPTDLRPVIAGAARFALSGSGTDCRIAVDEGLRSAEVDDGQVAQVIQNIVLNADQSMPLGGTVEIAARNVTAPGEGIPVQLAAGPYVQIAIRDRGVGIPEQYLSKIFDPYFTTKEKGSGLGLATSYSIVKNHGGLIDVRSEVGEGSTFVIYLPASPQEPAVTASTTTPAAARRARVLLMDDEEIVRKVTGRMLDALGQNVEYAQNGEEALGKYRAALEEGGRFDIVILDLTVRGGMGGAETLERLREIDPDVRAVVSSGYSDDAVVADFRKYGFRAFLKKPYDLDALRAVVAEMTS